MTLKEKIKQECDRQGIDIGEMLAKANVNRANYYHQFIAIWKPRIAATLGVDEEEFFKGFEDEISVHKRIKERENYAELKAKLVPALTNGWVTIPDMMALTGITSLKKINAMISGMRYTHIVEIKCIEGQKRSKKYHITSEIDKTKKETKAIPISKLPSKINKLDLLTWGISYSKQQFATSHDLVIYAKSKGKQVYEYNGRGEVYYL